MAEPKERWDILFNSAQQKLREKHPDIDIKVDYRVLPYDATRTQILTAMAGRTPIDSCIGRSNMAWRICSRRISE